jgi:iron-sulfur cluster assembly protein
MPTPSIQTPLIEITEAAHVRLVGLLREQPSGMGLRMAVAGGGCSGFSYKLDFTPEQPHDTVIELTDGVRIFIDPKSLSYLKGTRLDYQGGLNGKGFTFVNPNASSTCGCGESFCA